VSGWLVSPLPPYRAVRWRVPAQIEAAGRLGGPGDGVGSGQAELFRPGLEVRPEPVALVQVLFGGGVGQDHRGDRGVAVHDSAGQPGHFPSVRAAGLTGEPPPTSRS
jgi:hypothetical protein